MKYAIIPINEAKLVFEKNEATKKLNMIAEKANAHKATKIMLRSVNGNIPPYLRIKLTSSEIMAILK